MGMMERTKPTDECITDRDAIQDAKVAAREGKEEDLHHFPSKLHRMLMDIDRRQVEKSVISWQPHGRCFLIKDQTRFEEEVMPAWFRGIKFSSFRRQLHLFGFRKLGRQGPDKGAYWHELFDREKPKLASRMKPVPRGSGKRGRKPRSEDLDPDFYKSGRRPPSSPEKGDSSEAKSPRKRGSQQGGAAKHAAAESGLTQGQQLAAGSFFTQESQGPSLSARHELRHLDSTTGNLHYQHAQVSNPMPQSSAASLPLPLSFPPLSTPAGDGDLEPLPVHAGVASSANFQIGHAYARQGQEHQFADSAPQHPQRPVHHEFGLPQSFQLQQQLQLQQHEQQIDQQIQQQRLMLQEMQPQVGLGLPGNQRMQHHFSSPAESFQSPFSQQQLFNQQQLPIRQQSSLDQTSLLSIQQQQPNMQQMSLSQMQMQQQQQLLMQQQQHGQVHFQHGMFSFQQQHNPNFPQDQDDNEHSL